jgi:AcrR family transcriptional regulator
MGRQQLNRTRIVATAMEMADEEGLEAVTLRGLAARLGVHVTSLYNHVRTREAILDGMVECLITEANLPTRAIAWEDWVRRFAAAMRAVGRNHPGAFEALYYRPVQGPRAADSVEAALAAFRSAGFDVVSAYSAVKATTVAVLGLVLQDLAHLRTPGLRTDLSALPVERFPRLHEADVIAAEADNYAYLIDALVDGFAASLRRSRTGRRRTTARR